MGTFTHGTGSPVLPQPDGHRPARGPRRRDRRGSAATRCGCCQLRDPAHRATRASMRTSVASPIELARSAQARIERQVCASCYRLFAGFAESEQRRTRSSSRAAGSAPVSLVPSRMTNDRSTSLARTSSDLGRQCSRRLADRLRRLEAERPGEHGQPAQDRPFLTWPTDRDSTRWWLRGSDGGAALSCSVQRADGIGHRDARRSGRGQACEADGRKFDRQRDPIETTSKFKDGRLVLRGHLERGSGLPRALDQQGDRF